MVMHKKIRNSVFETNSSSVHSLVIATNLEQSNLKINPETNFIDVITQYFGKEYNIYSTQKDKLSYIVTYIVTYLEDKYEDKYKNWETFEIILKKDCNFQTLEKIIKEYCNCSGLNVIVDWDGGFDHQTHPSNCEAVINLNDEEAIKNFIFNKFITLKTEWD